VQLEAECVLLDDEVGLKEFQIPEVPDGRRIAVVGHRVPHVQSVLPQAPGSGELAEGGDDVCATGSMRTRRMIWSGVSMISASTTRRVSASSRMVRRPPR
jgi:hypothetical protein